MGYSAYCIKTMKNILEMYPDLEQYLPFRKNSSRSKWKCFSKEQILDFARNSKNHYDFMSKMGYTTSRRDIYEEIIKTYPEVKVQNHAESSWKNFSYEELLQIASQSANETDFCKKLGYKNRSGLAIEQIKETYPDIDILKGENECKWKFFSEEQLQKIANDSDGFVDFYKRLGYTVSRGRGDIREAILEKYPNFIFPKPAIRSQGEQKIAQILTEMGLLFKEQYWFKDLRGENKAPLRFDFLIVNLDQLIAIEYQGEQHYEEINFFKETLQNNIKRDNKKRLYCKQNNIILIEIPYWDFNKIDENYLKEKINEYSN